MVVAFGWSAGDIADAVICLRSLAKAFKSAGGARERYAEEGAFLESFALTLSRLNEYTTANPDAKYSKDIEKHVELISGYCAKFDKFLQKYNDQLSSTGSRASAKVVWKTVKWAVDDELRDKVNGLRGLCLKLSCSWTHSYYFKYCMSLGNIVVVRFTHSCRDDLARLSVRVARLAISTDNTGVVTALSDAQSSLDDIKGVTSAMKTIADANHSFYRKCNRPSLSKPKP